MFGFFFFILEVFSRSPQFRPEGYFFGIFYGNSGSGHVGAP